MDSAKKFSFADHCLINAATEIAVARIRNHAAMRDVLATFKDVLPEVSRENLMIDDLATAVEELVAHYHPKRGSAGLTAAQFHLAASLEKIHRWKHALSMAAWQQSKGKKP